RQLRVVDKPLQQIPRQGGFHQFGRVLAESRDAGFPVQRARLQGLRVEIGHPKRGIFNPKKTLPAYLKCAGNSKPFRSSALRLPIMGASTVKTMALKPEAMARFTRFSVIRLSLYTYS